VTLAGRASTLGAVADRYDGEPGTPAVADDDDWFRDPFMEPDEPTSEVVWEDDDYEPPPPSGPPGLGERQAVVVLAVVAIVVVIALAILLVRAFGGSDGGSATTTAPTTATETVSTSTTSTETGSTTTTPTDTTPSASAVPTGETIRPGATGASVEALQLALTELGYEPGAADGNYGNATAQAVTAFQAAEGLKEDGIAGPETIAAINTALGG